MALWIGDLLLIASEELGSEQLRDFLKYVADKLHHLGRVLIDLACSAAPAIRHAVSGKIPMIVAVRGYAVPVDKKVQPNIGNRNANRRKHRKALKWPSKYAIIFDTETTTDHAQNLRLGTYQVRKDGRKGPIENGIFYERATLSTDEFALLEAYASKKLFGVAKPESFIRDILYRYGYYYGGLIIGFNQPFDLSRLAISIGTSHGRDMRGGFSLELVPEKSMPNILVKHLNSRAAFIRFAAAPRAVDGRSMRKKFKTQARTGHFQDLKTLAAALLGRSFDLASLADLLGTQHRKMRPKSMAAS